MPERLTIDDLAASWHCSTATAWEIVRTRGVPFVWLGPGEPDLARRGRKPVVFRGEDVAAWERGQTRVWEPGDTTPRRAQRVEPVVTIAGVAIGGRLRAGGGIRGRGGVA